MVDTLKTINGYTPRLPAGTGEQTHILAAIDIGTNSIHMVVAKIQPHLPAFTFVTREKEAVRLGDRDPKTGNLKPEVMERAIAALRRCQEVAQSANAEQIIAVATSAVREAPNGRDFIKRVQSELGLFINLISGQEEARRIYLGVLSGMEFDTQPHIVIDIGGGSTELILGDGREPRSLSSTKVGAVRLTSEFVTTDPIDSEEFNYLRAYIRGNLERPVEELRVHLQPGETPRMVGTSGTIESLAALHAHKDTGSIPDPLNGYEFSLEDLRGIVNKLRKEDYDDRADMPGMSERRAEIIVAGALILQEAMDLLGVESIVICERALREGLIVDWMLTHGLIEDRLYYQSSVRQRSIFKIAHKYQVNVDSAQRIANFALDLFDQTQDQLHEWDEEARELLWASAMLHNCGLYISHSAHHKHSYYLIRNGELFGYTDLEIELIANLARYHRKSQPKKKHDPYRSLPKHYRKMVEQLSAMLRVAVALDRRQIGAIARLVCEIDTDEDEVHLYLHPTQPNDSCELELWSLDFKKLPFEEEFGVKLSATLVPALGESHRPPTVSAN